MRGKFSCGFVAFTLFLLVEKSISNFIDFSFNFFSFVGFGSISSFSFNLEGISKEEKWIVWFWDNVVCLFNAWSNQTMSFQQRWEWMEKSVLEETVLVEGFKFFGIKSTLKENFLLKVFFNSILKISIIFQTETVATNRLKDFLF